MYPVQKHFLKWSLPKDHFWETQSPGPILYIYIHICYGTCEENIFWQILERIALSGVSIQCTVIPRHFFPVVVLHNLFPKSWRIWRSLRAGPGEYLSPEVDWSWYSPLKNTIWGYTYIYISLPILDTLQKNKFFAGERRYSHWYQKTKGLKYPCKIDLDIWWYTYPSEKWWSSSVGMMKFPFLNGKS